MSVLPFDFTVLPSASQAATFNTQDFETVKEARGVLLFLDITVATAGTLDLKLEMKDPVSGAYVDMAGAAFAQKSATGTDSLTIYPGVTELADRKESDVMPRVWRLTATIVTGPFTFSVGGTYLR